MSGNEDLIVDPNTPARPNWASNTIQAAGELAGNPSVSRRTRSQLESALSAKDRLFVYKCFLMIESGPKTC